MPLDGALINCIRKELSIAVDCHIDKIYMPTKNEYVLHLRGRGFNKKLYISINPDAPRVGFTNGSFENPPSPPMFCMLLRKHLSGGRILAIECLGAERLITFKVASTNEMGDKQIYSLIVHLMGHKTNLILADQKGKILDAVRRSNIETDEELIVPGAIYSAPKQDERTDFLNGDLEKTAALCVGNELPLATALIKNVAGISPLICREIAYIITGNTEVLANTINKKELLNTLSTIKAKVLEGGVPYALTDQNGTPKDFSFIPIKQYGNTFSLEKYESFSDMLEAFYFKKDSARRLETLKSDTLKLLKNLISRNNKKLLLREKELKNTEDKERLRIYGELLKANLYKIPKGADSVTVENYYDSECKPVTIKLNTALSPQNNAAKYFKDYKKACNAANTLITLIDECKEELDYLESVLFALENAESAAEISQITTELKESGYIKLKKGESFKQKNTSAKPLVFIKNGYKIAVGRNNIQNDILTLKTAEKTDIWFHTKNIHGSHVILFTNGKEPEDEVVLFAANLAAKFSKAKNSNQVPVDYTQVKFVKKPSGAKPGMVIYKTNQTIFANPNQINISELEE